ncbi:PREDICTED: agamous-like MADS-box protein AGL97 [Camelina sativa]|uniref:Agamous-like MADS-box protein AGL97 n=1 Tax=Camelina sativa TaxID=90675 RepID=A0ABM0SLH1_CAMSA|nr:PREDICTED: agamous-like MADS-box protein AGL97 [Camelina sativa]
MPSNECTMTMKRGGTKRKIEIKKRDTKQQRSVACSKRRQTLFSKAADLCFLSGANIAVFVTSPAENNDVVYSFSGYSPASEIADCYLNGKPPTTSINPQTKLGFWWEDPDLYRNCDDISELNVIEDRMMRTRKHLMDCLEKKEKTQFVSNSDHQNPSSSSLDENPKSSTPSSCDEIASFEQNSTLSSFEKICGEPSSQATCYYDQNHTFAFEDLYRDDDGFVESLWETEKQRSDIMSIFQEPVL